MTKKHFQSVAIILGYSNISEDSIEELTEDFVGLFQEENPLFNPDLFRREVEKQTGKARYETKKMLGSFLLSVTASENAQENN